MKIVFNFFLWFFRCARSSSSRSWTQSGRRPRQWRASGLISLSRYSQGRRTNKNRGRTAKRVGGLQVFAGIVIWAQGSNIIFFFIFYYIVPVLKRFKLKKMSQLKSLVGKSTAHGSGSAHPKLFFFFKFLRFFFLGKIYVINVI